jgi:hypothetical protein
MDRCSRATLRRQHSTFCSEAWSQKYDVLTAHGPFRKSHCCETTKNHWRTKEKDDWLKPWLYTWNLRNWIKRMSIRCSCEFLWIRMCSVEQWIFGIWGEKWIVVCVCASVGDCSDVIGRTRLIIIFNTRLTLCNYCEQNARSVSNWS